MVLHIYMVKIFVKERWNLSQLLIQNSDQNLIKEAKERNLIYKDQAYIAGKGGEYPSDLKHIVVTKTGLKY